MNILIVENNTMVAQALAYTLLMGGHCVVGPVSRVDKIFAAMHVNLPDLALVDVHLAGRRDGIDCARILKLRYRIPTLFLSAHSDRARKGQQYAVGFLEKPVTAVGLLDSIRAVESILEGKCPPRIPAVLNICAALGPSLPPSA
jgi:two-component SAPR family response regulator